MKAAITILVAGSALLMGQDQPDRPPHPPLPVLEALDSDGDRIISAEEIENASESLAQLDEDNNGRLSEEETKPDFHQDPFAGGKRPREAKPSGDRPAPPVMEALDQNGDGTISKGELGKASKSLLELDENENGQLEPEELHPDPSEVEKDGEGGEGRLPFPPRPPRGFGR